MPEATWNEPKLDPSLAPHMATLLAARGNVEAAAREVDALFDGGLPWKLDGRLLTTDAAYALLSLHDYLNDLRIAIENGVVAEERPSHA